MKTTHKNRVILVVVALLAVIAGALWLPDDAPPPSLGSEPTSAGQQAFGEVVGRAGHADRDRAGGGAVRSVPARSGPQILCLGAGQMPLSGVCLYEAAVDGRFLVAPTPESISDREGLMPVPENPEAGSYWMLSKEGFQPIAWNGESTVVLLKGFELKGIVRREGGGPPVPNAVVQASTKTHDLQRLSLSEAGTAVPVVGPNAIAFARTDKAGRFSIQGLAHGDYRIMVGHDELIPIKVNGQYVGARVSPPCFVTIEMVGLVGYRVLFPDQVMLSVAYAHRGGLNVAYKGIESAIGRPTTTCNLPGQEYERCGIVTSITELEPLVLYALLSKSGPVKLTLHPKSASAEDYTTIYRANGASSGMGTLRFDLVGPGGEAIDCELIWESASGTPAHLSGPRLRSGDFPVEQLRWSGRFASNSDYEIYQGRYSVMPSKPFLRKLVTSTTALISAGKTRVVAKQVSVAVGQVVFDLGGKGCRIRMTGVTPSGVRDEYRTLFHDATFRLWLPEGVYQLHVTRPGYHPRELQFDATGGAQTVTVDGWVSRAR